MIHVIPPQPDDRPSPAALAPFLAFVATLIENPTRSATRVAQVVTLAGLCITLIAILVGTATGAGLAALYAGSAWTMSYYLHRRAGTSDGR